MSTLDGLKVEAALLLVEGALSRSDLERLYRRGAPRNAPRPQGLERERLVGAIVGRALGSDGRGAADRALKLALTRGLDKRAATEKRLLANMDETGAAELLENYGGLRFRKQRSRMIWAALSHTDTAIQGLGRKVLSQVLAGLARGEDTISVTTKQKEAGPARRLPGPDAAQLQVQVGRLRRDLSDRDEKIATLEKQVTALQSAEGRATGAQRREEAARQELDQLHKDQAREVDGLRAELRQLQAALAEAEGNAQQAGEQASQVEASAPLPADPRLQAYKEQRDKAQRESAQLQERLRQAQKRLPEGDVGEGLLVLLDLANLSAGARVFDRPIDYPGLVRRLCAQRRPKKVLAFAAGDPDDDGSKRFTEALQAEGFDLHWKPLWRRADGSTKADWDVGITLAALRFRTEVDTVILGSGDGDFVELVEQLQNEGLRVEAAGWPGRSHRRLEEQADLFHRLDEGDLLP